MSNAGRDDRGITMQADTSTKTDPIEIVLNGERRAVPAGTTLAGLLQLLELESGRVAIELDRHIVKQPHWESTVLNAGAAVEIVQFVGGG